MTAPKPLIPLVIDRARWLRGDPGTSTLRNERGDMCCLGFACLASGYTEDEILDRAVPTDLDRMPDWPVPARRDALTANDSCALTDAARERALKPLLKQLGFAVTFTGEGHP